jgi:hypothetical protein
MDDETIARHMGEMKTDIKWIKNQLLMGDKIYAKKWVEKVQWVMLSGAVVWMIAQVLNLIKVAEALFIQ